MCKGLDWGKHEIIISTKKFYFSLSLYSDLLWNNCSLHSSVVCILFFMFLYFDFLNGFPVEAPFTLSMTYVPQYNDKNRMGF